MDLTTGLTSPRSTPDEQISRAPGTRQLVARVLRSPGGCLGLAMIMLIVGIAVIGPLVAPYGYNQIVGAPFEAPSAHYLLGTDFLGRDVLSRILDGGRVVLVVAVLSTALAYLVGLPVGMIAGYRRGPLDLAVTGAVDLLLSLPSIVFVLVLLAAAGASLSVVVTGIAATQVPRIVRVTRAATVEVGSLEYVEAAVARGDSVLSIIRRDILPNIATPVLTDLGLRFVFCVLLYSSLAFLGLGQPPPAADWGLIISENQEALTYRPLICLVPACLIAVLAIGASLVSDSVARTMARGEDHRDR
jgi:peptide/nickel transport system permease protein